MIFRNTELRDVKCIRLTRHEDSRGAFSRMFCKKEFLDAGIGFSVVQSSVSFNTAAGTLRGMHFQATPYGESKIVICTNGSIYDVVVDLRSSSPTYLQWQGFVLSGGDSALYIPKGFAHGFLTMQKDSHVLYYMDREYVAESARGIRYNDPAIGIDWPQEIQCISDKDLSYPDINVEEGLPYGE